MRANGVDERLCTGDAAPWDKHAAWCATVPYALRNPLYHWSHLELKRYFGIDAVINPASAKAIWEQANAKLSGLRVHDILAANKVAVICTTDDPADSLEVHERIRKTGLKTRVYPTFRPDKAFLVRQPAVFNAYLEKLAGAAGRGTVKSFDDFLATLKKRHDDFHAFGGRLSDHGMETAFAEPCTPAEAKAIFDAARGGQAATPGGFAQFSSFLMLVLGRWDAARGWTKQLHLGALRSNSTRSLEKLGPDTGFDSIGDFSQARALSRYLDKIGRAHV